MIILIVIVIGIIYLFGLSAKYSYKRKVNQAAAFKNYLKTTDPQTQMMHAGIALVAFYLFNQHKKTKLEEKKMKQETDSYNKKIQNQKVISNPKANVNKVTHEIDIEDEK